MREKNEKSVLGAMLANFTQAWEIRRRKDALAEDNNKSLENSDERREQKIGPEHPGYSYKDANRGQLNKVLKELVPYPHSNFG